MRVRRRETRVGRKEEDIRGEKKGRLITSCMFSTFSLSPEPRTKPSSDPVKAPDFAVILGPMQIRTFAVKMQPEN